ncbi:MAG: prepilin-type N-terminal cleavage/methylation domain-containing protein, partial [Pseudomonadota bacterium]
MLIQRQRGFSLLEIVIATGLSALLVLVVISALRVPDLMVANLSNEVTEQATSDIFLEKLQREVSNARLYDIVKCTGRSIVKDLDVTASNTAFVFPYLKYYETAAILPSKKVRVLNPEKFTVNDLVFLRDSEHSDNYGFFRIKAIDPTTMTLELSQDNVIPPALFDCPFTNKDFDTIKGASDAGTAVLGIVEYAYYSVAPNL